MSDDNSNETGMNAEDIAIVFEGSEVFVRRCLGHTCVPLGYPSELAEYDAWLRKAIENVRCVTPGYWHDAGCRAAIALNPGTSLAMIEELLQDLDMVLIMTVNPGFGGQKFIASTLDKIHMLSHTIHDMGYDCDIEVDGGINEETAALVTSAGANVLVAGSAVYGAPDVQKAIAAIRAAEQPHVCHDHAQEEE